VAAEKRGNNSKLKDRERERERERGDGWLRMAKLHIENWN